MHIYLSIHGKHFCLGYDMDDDTSVAFAGIALHHFNFNSDVKCSTLFIDKGHHISPINDELNEIASDVVKKMLSSKKSDMMRNVGEESPDYCLVFEKKYFVPIHSVFAAITISDSLLIVDNIINAINSIGGENAFGVQNYDVALYKKTRIDDSSDAQFQYKKWNWKSIDNRSISFSSIKSIVPRAREDAVFRKRYLTILKKRASVLIGDIGDKQITDELVEKIKEYVSFESSRFFKIESFSDALMAMSGMVAVFPELLFYGPKEYRNFPEVYTRPKANTNDSLLNLICAKLSKIIINTSLATTIFKNHGAEEIAASFVKFVTSNKYSDLIKDPSELIFMIFHDEDDFYDQEAPRFNENYLRIFVAFFELCLFNTIMNHFGIDYNDDVFDNNNNDDDESIFKNLFLMRMPGK